MATIAAMYSGPKASSSAAAAASAATRLTWWVAASAGKTASSSGWRELRVVPDHHARLRAGERLAGAAGDDVRRPRAAGPGTGRRRSARAGGRRRRRPCRPTRSTISAISRTGQREQRHRRAERDQLRAVRRGRRRRTRRGRPRARCASNGTSTMFRPRMPAGPSWRLELWPPTGCGIVITVSPGSVSAA